MNSSNLNSIQQQANDWLVKLETGAMEPGDEDRFAIWLESNESHSEAFYDAEQTWQTMHQVSADALRVSASEFKKESENPFEITDTADSKDNVVPLHIQEQQQLPSQQNQSIKKSVPDQKIISNQTPKSPSTPSPLNKLVRVLMPLAATFVITFIAIFLGQDAWFSVTADHYAATGDRYNQRLSDGSFVTLNTNTAVNVHFTDGQRLVELVMGEIYVDVYPDSQRPFVVQAGELQVTALGTEFIVRKEADKNPGGLRHRT